MPPFISVISRLFEDKTRPEPFHFHSGDQGRAVVCHDLDCGSPHLDIRDAHALRGEFAHLR